MLNFTHLLTEPLMFGSIVDKCFADNRHHTEGYLCLRTIILSGIYWTKFG